ncbi:hypothetical protein ACX17A_23710 [Bacillus cereus]
MEKIDSFSSPSSESTNQENIINPPPPAEGEEIIDANGKRYRCRWEYCCQPIGPKPLFPQCKNPTENERKFDFILAQHSNFPEFKAEKCDNQFGFCLSTRRSTIRLLGRVIYPRNVAETVEAEIKDCFNKAMLAGAAAASPLIAVMIDQPETIPALLPQAVETALEQALITFKQCIISKAQLSYLFKTKKIQLCVFHEQTRGNEGWRPLTSRDIVKMLDQLSFAQFAMVQLFLPGVGSYEQLAQKLGIDTEKLSSQITGGLQSLGAEGQKILDQLKGAITNPVGTAKKGFEKVGDELNKVGNKIQEIPGRLPKIKW